MKTFANFHPFTIFSYFMTTIVLTMITYNPVILVISFVSSIIYSLYLNKPKIFFMNISFYLITFVLIVLANPLFSHNGKTILFFLNDNAITLEAIIYGVSIATLFIAIMYWFSVFNQVMDSDKTLFLFQGIIPTLGLIISMGLKFIPNFIKKRREIKNTQKTLGLYSKGGIFNRLENSIKVFLALLTWAIDSSLDTSLSMKARGYGIGKRSNYSLYRFKRQDFIVMLINLVTIVLFIYMYVAGNLDFYYYPTISNLKFDIYLIVFLSLLSIYMLLPVLYEIKEKIKWHYLKSKI